MLERGKKGKMRGRESLTPFLYLLDNYQNALLIKCLAKTH